MRINKKITNLIKMFLQKNLNDSLQLNFMAQRHFMYDIINIRNYFKLYQIFQNGQNNKNSIVQNQTIRMITISPSCYIPWNISSNKDNLILSVNTLNQQDQHLYGRIEKSDMILKLCNQQYHVHSQIITKNTKLLANHQVKVVQGKYKLSFALLEAQGKNKVSKQICQKILKYLYGYEITLHRCDIHHAYQLCYELEIQSILIKFHQDMINYIDQYEIFPLLKFSYQYNIQQVKDTCYQQLLQQHFQPLRYNKSGLLLCDEDLFKTILKKHNIIKLNNPKYGLENYQIQDLINDYCQANLLKKNQKQNFINDIQNYDNQKYTISLNQVKKNSVTPRKVKSSSQIFFRNTLSLPRQRNDEQNQSFEVDKNRSFQRSNNQDDSKSDLRYNPLSPFTPNYNKKDEQKSLSNLSTDNKSVNGRSRKQSQGSIESISDLKIIATIAHISDCQKSIFQDNQQIKKKAQVLSKRLELDKLHSKITTSKLQQLSNWLQQYQAQLKNNASRISQVQKTVNKLQSTQNKRQAKRKFNQMFQNSINLDLTMSKSFGHQ